MVVELHRFSPPFEKTFSIATQPARLAVNRFKNQHQRCNYQEREIRCQKGAIFQRNNHSHKKPGKQFMI